MTCGGRFSAVSDCMYVHIEKIEKKNYLHSWIQSIFSQIEMIIFKKLLIKSQKHSINMFFCLIFTQFELFILFDDRFNENIFTFFVCFYFQIF